MNKPVGDEPESLVYTTLMDAYNDYYVRELVDTNARKHGAIHGEDYHLELTDGRVIDIAKRPRVECHCWVRVRMVFKDPARAQAYRNSIVRSDQKR